MINGRVRWLSADRTQALGPREIAGDFAGCRDRFPPDAAEGPQSSSGRRDHGSHPAPERRLRPAGPPRPVAEEVLGGRLTSHAGLGGHVAEVAVWLGAISHLEPSSGDPGDVTVRRT